MNLKEVARVLQAVPGLSDAPPHVLDSLATNFERRVVTDDYICREGEAADSLFVLTAGRLTVLKRGDDGEDRVIAHLTPVCLFGNVAVVRWGQRTASVRAPRWAEVLHMPAQRVRQLINDWDFTAASPLRRALIVATGWQLAQANRAVSRLAIDAGVAEAVATSDKALPESAVPPDVAPPAAEPADPKEAHVPEDAEERLLEARGRL